jgi:hypothetical protein
MDCEFYKGMIIVGKKYDIVSHIAHFCTLGAHNVQHIENIYAVQDHPFDWMDNTEYVMKKISSSIFDEFIKKQEIKREKCLFIISLFGKYDIKFCYSLPNIIINARKFNISFLLISDNIEKIPEEIMYFFQRRFFVCPLTGKVFARDYDQYGNLIEQHNFLTNCVDADECLSISKFPIEMDKEKNKDKKITTNNIIE